MGEANNVDVPDSTARYIARIDAAAGNSRRTYAIPTFIYTSCSLYTMT